MEAPLQCLPVCCEIYGRRVVCGSKSSRIPQAGKMPRVMGTLIYDDFDGVVIVRVMDLRKIFVVAIEGTLK